MSLLLRIRSDATRPNPGVLNKASCARGVARADQRESRESADPLRTGAAGRLTSHRLALHVSRPAISSCRSFPRALKTALARTPCESLCMPSRLACAHEELSCQRHPGPTLGARHPVLRLSTKPWDTL
eukprot:UN2190